MFPEYTVAIEIRILDALRERDVKSLTENQAFKYSRYQVANVNLPT